MIRLLTCSLVGIIIDGATGSAGLCFILISANATLLVTQVCCNSCLSLVTSGTRLRSTARRIDGITITSAMSHGCLNWRSCRTIYLAGLMMPLIEFVCHSQALMAMSSAHHNKCSTLMHRSRCILSEKVCMGLRLRQCYFPMG